ncbi:prepilin peptidase [Candidatus Parcubacteria bacterium]|nr:MAG: prepilin peptidase [Candidatus Parcubacteria bacterium]
MAEILVWGLFGVITGSFLNVLILRHGKAGIGGRSACMTCNTTLRVFDLVPIVSWLLLKGRCRYCGSAISIQYPIVELLTGVAFAFLGGAPIELIFKVLGLPIAALLIAIAVHDFRTTIIPDQWTIILGILTLFTAIAGAYSTSGEYIVPFLAGPLAALPLLLLWYVSKGRWMGLGDPKLALSIGWLLGFPGGVNAILLAFIIGAIVCVPLLIPTYVFQKAQSSLTIRKPGFLYRLRSLGNKYAAASLFPSSRLTMKSEIPFGPFLVAACFVVWFSHMYNVAVLFVWQ